MVFLIYCKLKLSLPFSWSKLPHPLPEPAISKLGAVVLGDSGDITVPNSEPSGSSATVSPPQVHSFLKQQLKVEDFSFFFPSDPVQLPVSSRISNSNSPAQSYFYQPLNPKSNCKFPFHFSPWRYLPVLENSYIFWFSFWVCNCCI